jgi:LmbE family N-acetylglucosaminyl deacetylase
MSTPSHDRITFCLGIALALGLLARAQTPASAALGDVSAAAAWERLQKLRTTASLLHTTAHPDDEQGAMLAMVSRHDGVRTGLLTLNRGEAGDNALGPELFDALALIRTAELGAAGRYYGVDAQYFTSAVDYGFSKRLDEALEHWDRETLLRDMVRTIRRFRPLVVVSRWQGTDRDGHGQHQAAGALTPDAVRLAADASAFPDLLDEGARPWRVRKLYIGGVRDGEPWQVRVETGVHDPVLGTSYDTLGRLGLSIQRSQSSGRFDPYAGGEPLFFRLGTEGDARAALRAPARESGFFDGLDVRVSGAYALTGEMALDGHQARLDGIARDVEAAIASFSMTRPFASAAAMARGLVAMRELAGQTVSPDVRFLLDVKVRQFEEALAAVAGISLSAVAEPTTEGGGQPDPFSPPATLGPPSPGDTFAVHIVAANAGTGSFDVARLALVHPGGTVATDVPGGIRSLAPSERRAHTFTVTLPADAEPTRPYFVRRRSEDARYTLLDPSMTGLPGRPPPLTASAEVQVAGASFSVRVPVMRREANLPWGYEIYPVEILPPVSVALRPRARIVRAGTAGPVILDALVSSHASRPVDGSVELKVPAGWTSSPERAPFSLQAAGASQRIRFSVHTPGTGAEGTAVTAAAHVAGRVYSDEVEAIRYRDLPVQYLYREARALVRSVDVAVAPGVTVGYVMGVGDEVPEAIAQLGASVHLLTEPDLASGDLTRFPTIVTGTRAYAVRADLQAHNARLLDYVRAGGNLVVLYNTPEFTPGTQAPYAASLPAEAEEVCEESAPVEILAPDDPLLSEPNRINAADFDGWLEQRGSKFFTRWDARYVALLSTHDRGQPAQRGGMLHARVGKGHYTYMAYALHRQLPAGVPGAYRLLANLISLGRSRHVQ